MKTFYDRIVPQVVSDQLKKVGGRWRRLDYKPVAPHRFFLEKHQSLQVARQASPSPPRCPIRCRCSRRLAPRPIRRSSRRGSSDSKVVDAEGKPLVVYRGGGSEYDELL